MRAADESRQEKSTCDCVGFFFVRVDLEEFEWIDACTQNTAWVV